MTVLVWDVDKLRFATDAAGIALWSWNVDTDRLELDERGLVLWGFRIWESSRLKFFPLVSTLKTWTV
jgi:hypothetical protein